MFSVGDKPAEDITSFTFMIQFLFNCLFIASVGMIWKNLQKDFPLLHQTIHALPWWLKKPIHCSFCFIYWFTLGFILIQNEYQGWYSLFFNWLIMALGGYLVYTIARILYFTMELLFEKHNKIDNNQNWILF